MVDFGERIRNLRKQLGISQEQLGERLGVTKSMVSSYETSMRMPSYTVLVKIAKLFHVSTDYLLGLDTGDTVNIAGLSPKQKALIMALVTELENGRHEMC